METLLMLISMTLSHPIYFTSLFPRAGNPRELYFANYKFLEFIKVCPLSSPSLPLFAIGDISFLLRLLVIVTSLCF